MLETLMMSDGDPASGWAVKDRVVATEVVNSSKFGTSIAVSTDKTRMIVGAPDFTGGNGVQAGAAFIFIRVSGQWVEEAKIVASDITSSNQFGFSVAIDGTGTRVIVGAPQKNSGTGTYQGAAYVYRYSGTAWIEERKFLPTDPAAQDRFGWSVAISEGGNYVAIGAPRKSSSVSLHGAIYSWSRAGITWSNENKLLASDPLVNALLGQFVMFGDKLATPSSIIAGAVATNTNYGVYIFQRTGAGTSAWTQEVKITRPTPRPTGSYFSQFVSISEDGLVMLVGEPRLAGHSGAQEGGVHIFRKIDNVWTADGFLSASDSHLNSWFGHSGQISSDGTYAVIGATQQNQGLANQGSLYLFRNVEGTWIEEAKIFTSESGANGRLGTSVSIFSDELILSGAPENTTPGSVYEFRKLG